MNDLIQDFIAETRETLEIIQGELVAWEANPNDRARLESIFRFFHTVKGSCGFLDLPRLTRLSHSAEDALDMVRRRERQPDALMVTSILAIADRIALLVGGMETGEPIPDGDDSDLIVALDGPHTLTAIADAAAAPEPPVPLDSSRGGHNAAAQNWTVRVPLQLLDQLMNGVSDLVLARNELSRQLRSDLRANQVETAFEQLSAHVAQLREAVGGMRMQRMERLYGALPRLVRDVAQDLNKRISLELVGGEVEIDREMIDLVRDPLTHVIRNAADHGLEDERGRRAANKPAVGRIRVSARQVGNQVMIEVADDGRGIDVDRLVAKAVTSRVTNLAAVTALDERQKLALVFHPGLSTAATVSPISGRGVGMDVVRTRLETIGGAVELDNAPGQGLTVTMRVPLTLSIITGLIVRAGGQFFAVSQSAVDEIIGLGAAGALIREVAGVSVADVRGNLLPHVCLENVLGLPKATAEVTRSLVVLHAGMGGRFALEVAEVIDSEELVVKPAVPALLATGLYAGMSLPNSGTPMLLLDATGIANRTGLSTDLGLPSLSVGESAATAPAADILLFRTMAGQQRAIRLEAIERMDELPINRCQWIDGHWRIADDMRSGVVLGLDGGLPEGRPALRLLRLSDGDTLRFLAIAEALDIIAIDSPVEPPMQVGEIEGIIQIAGVQIELVDPSWLFEQARPAGHIAPRRRRCHIVAAPHDGWSRTVLRPLLARAGYSVTCGEDDSADGIAAEIIVAPQDIPVAAGARTLVRLGTAQAPGEFAVDRYDRHALLDILTTIAAKDAA